METDSVPFHRLPVENVGPTVLSCTNRSLFMRVLGRLGAVYQLDDRSSLRPILWRLAFNSCAGLSLFFVGLMNQHKFVAPVSRNGFGGHDAHGQKSLRVLGVDVSHPEVLGFFDIALVWLCTGAIGLLSAAYSLLTVGTLMAASSDLDIRFPAVEAARNIDRAAPPRTLHAKIAFDRNDAVTGNGAVVPLASNQRPSSGGGRGICLTLSDMPPIIVEAHGGPVESLLTPSMAAGGGGAVRFWSGAAHKLGSGGDTTHRQQQLDDECSSPKSSFYSAVDGEDSYDAATAREGCSPRSSPNTGRVSRADDDVTLIKSRFAAISAVVEASQHAATSHGHASNSHRNSDGAVQRSAAALDHETSSHPEEAIIQPMDTFQFDEFERQNPGWDSFEVAAATNGRRGSLKRWVSVDAGGGYRQPRTIPADSSILLDDETDETITFSAGRKESEGRTRLGVHEGVRIDQVTVAIPLQEFDETQEASAAAAAAAAASSDDLSSGQPHSSRQERSSGLVTPAYYGLTPPYTDVSPPAGDTTGYTDDWILISPSITAAAGGSSVARLAITYGVTAVGGILLGFGQWGMKDCYDFTPIPDWGPLTATCNVGIVCALVVLCGMCCVARTNAPRFTARETVSTVVCFLGVAVMMAATMRSPWPLDARAVGFGAAGAICSTLSTLSMFAATRLGFSLLSIFVIRALAVGVLGILSLLCLLAISSVREAVTLVGPSNEVLAFAFFAGLFQALSTYSADKASATTEPSSRSLYSLTSATSFAAATPCLGGLLVSVATGIKTRQMPSSFLLCSMVFSLLGFAGLSFFRFEAFVPRWARRGLARVTPSSVGNQSDSQFHREGVHPLLSRAG